MSIVADPSGDGKGAVATKQTPPVNRLVGAAPNIDVAPDPFDNLESLRLSQDYAASLGVQKVLTRVGCRKPDRQEFIRVRPGEDWRFETAVYEDKASKDVYLVAPDLACSALLGEVKPVCLFLTITKQGTVFFWPVRLPGPDGRSNPWNETALAAARLAETKWIRVASNMTAGEYDVYQASADLADPVWPEGTFQELLKLCFKDRFIREDDHPAIRALRGLA